ncbi:hypothetical protein LOD99_14591 [Oopsacas minuta]|uniref:V(D)J recombination-activating protein 1 RNase H domain-containing protein n=1 Tax=Oopsacas minuta TaxID=111878 RepID=A0AAV7KEJ9_9METZ|nr:hypothetical protein LOD99_14591 [Oopsacas minuta]
MTTKEAFDFLSSRKSVRDATIVFMDSEQLDDKYYSCIRYKFVELKGDREIFRKRNDLNTWNDMIFFDNSTLAEKRRLSSEGDNCTPNHVDAKAIRKPLLELTIKGQRKFSATDGLDGSGSHQVYNQIQESPDIGSKNFILFAFKLLAIHDSANKFIWENERPNSQFQIRPVTLLAAKENSENVRHLMDTYINSYVVDLEENGIPLSQRLVRIKLLRTMFDGKMAEILSGAGGAHCQLCTATFKQLHDVELIRDGFPINRSITSAKELFQSVNEVEFLSLSSNDRLGLTHQPISDIDVICSSPLHSYLCIFRWFMTLVYHLQSGEGSDHHHP